MYEELKKIGEVENPAKEGQHAMVVLHNSLYILDGKNIYQWEVEPETLWVKIKQLLGLWLKKK